MITVSIDFAVYFYILSTFGLIFAFWFYWRTKDFANLDDFKYQGRTPLKTCELCDARYIDSTNNTYSTCPKCSHLTPIR